MRDPIPMKKERKRIIEANRQQQIKVDLNVSFLVTSEKDDTLQTDLFSVRDMNEKMALIQMLTTYIVSKNPLDQIGHPLCGRTILGFNLTVETLESLKRRTENETIGQGQTKLEDKQNDPPPESDGTQKRLVNLT